MRNSTSKPWMFLAAVALLSIAFPLSTGVAFGAPPTAGTPTTAGASGPRVTPAPGANVKVQPSPADDATPAPVTYNTIDGSWEVQLQPGRDTVYCYLDLLNRDSVISGTWKRPAGKRDFAKLDLTGTLAGDRFSFNGSDAKGPFTLAGYIENSATMVGAFTQAGTSVAFTATHQGVPLSERPPKHRHGRHHRGQDAQTVPDVTVPAPTPTP